MANINKYKFIKSEFDKIIPDCKIKSITKFDSGLVSFVYKIELYDKKEQYCFKIAKKKHEERIKKNSKILNYLGKFNIKTPKVYQTKLIGDYIIVLMDYIQGKSSYKEYENSSKEDKNKILYLIGKELYKIHNIEIPKFWISYQHEIKTSEEWINWTSKRVEKYILFLKENFDIKYYNYFEKELKELNYLLCDNFDIKALHWDYHLNNININCVDEDNCQISVFDFDNCMKGHNLADIGQALYWNVFEHNQRKNFKYFLKGYLEKYKNKEFNNNELKLIYMYCVLQMLAVIRSNNHKKRLKWLIDKHLGLLNEIIDNKITFELLLT